MISQLHCSAVYPFRYERGWDSWADYHSTRYWKAILLDNKVKVAYIVHYSNGFAYDLRYECHFGSPICPETYQTDDAHDAVRWLKNKLRLTQSLGKMATAGVVS